MANAKRTPEKVSVLVTPELYARIQQEQSRIQKETGFKVSATQCCAAILDRHLPAIEQDARA